MLVRTSAVHGTQQVSRLQMDLLKWGLPQGDGFRLSELDSSQTYLPSCLLLLCSFFFFEGKFGTFVGVVLSESFCVRCHVRKRVVGLCCDPWERIRSGGGDERGHLLRVTLTRRCVGMSKLLFLKICPLWSIRHFQPWNERN